MSYMRSALAIGIVALALCAACPVPARPAQAGDLFARLSHAAPALDRKVLALALEARACAMAGGEYKASERLAIIDYTRPSTQTRLWIFDVKRGRLLYAEHVAHGRGSGGNMATRFSNVEGSYQSSLGLFVAARPMSARTATRCGWMVWSPGSTTAPASACW